MVVDIILIILLAICVIYGFFKGAVKILTKLLSIVIALVFAWTFASQVGTYIANNTELGTSTKTAIESKLTDFVLNEKNENNAIIANVTKLLNIDINESKEAVVSKISNFIFTGIGFGIIYFALSIILLIVSFILEKIFELPVLSTFNRLGGVIIGIIIFLIETSVIMSIIYFMSSFGFMEGIVTAVNSSKVGEFIYNNNVINYIILNKIKN